MKKEDDDDEEEEEEESKEEERPNPDPVQILDLHSENPMVSYRGQVFACEWASNTGTELLFTARNQESPLPVLRSLPGDVDLLAASSCRIVPKAVTLEAKLATRNRMATDLTTTSKTGHSGSGISIPVGTAASQKRKDQARFLEQLISIKQEKGEKDQITVIAQKRQLNNKWKLIWRKKRQTEKNRLLRFIRHRGNARSSREEVENAKRRIKEIEDEEGIQENQVPMTSRGHESMAYKSGRKRKAPSSVPSGRADDVGTPTRAGWSGIGAGSGTTSPSMSTHARQLWADVDAEDELGGYMENEEYMEGQDMEYGEYDEMLYEEDPEGELYE